MRALLLVLLFLSVPLSAALNPSADEILRRSDRLRSPTGDFSFVVRAQDFGGGKLSRDTTYRVFSKGSKYSLIETIAPERLKGRKLLMRDNGLWLHLPTINRPTRVSMQQRLTGEVSNGDLARTEFYDDYKAKLLGVEKLGKAQCYKLHLSAKSSEVTYRTIQLWVEKKSFRPLRADFFALSGKLLKTGEYGGFQKVLGGVQATRMVIRDALQPSRRTELAYSKYKRESLGESFFNKESLVN